MVALTAQSQTSRVCPKLQETGFFRELGVVDKLGVELGYRMSEDTGYDVEDCITCATKGLKLRVARRVWRDYYRHSFARRHNADPSTEGLADQQREWKIREDDWRREAQERARQHEFWATKARNLSAWAPRGMG